MVSEEEEEGWSSELGEEEYLVERILDYKIQYVSNTKDEPGYDPSLGSRKWQPRYLVCWQGYGPEENTWEPRESFSSWHAAYDADLSRIQQEHPEKGNPFNMAKEAVEKNKNLVKRKRGDSRAPSQTPGASSAMSRIPSARTSNVSKAAGNWDVKEFVEIQGIHSPSLMSLIPDSPPRRDAEGNLIPSRPSSRLRSTVEKKPKVELESPPPMEPLAPIVETDLGFADDTGDYFMDIDEASLAPPPRPPPPKAIWNQASPPIGESSSGPPKPDRRASHPLPERQRSVSNAPERPGAGSSQSTISGRRVSGSSIDLQRKKPPPSQLRLEASQLSQLKSFRIGKSSEPPLPSPALVTTPPSPPPVPAKSIDPRPRPKPVVPQPAPVPIDLQASKRPATTGSAHTAKPIDPLNQGVVRPTTVASFVILNKEVITQKLKAFENGWFRASKFQRIGADDTLEKIYHAWGIPDIMAGFMTLEVLRGRECWVYAPQKDEMLKKAAKSVNEDYLALQYLLAHHEMRQADTLRASVKCVFIHVSEEHEIGRFVEDGVGNLSGLEAFRARRLDDTLFVLFGTRWDEKLSAQARQKVFNQFWSVQAAITFSPSAFADAPDAAAKLFADAKESRKLFPGRRDKFVWLPQTYLVKGGPFYIPPATAASKDIAERALFAGERQRFLDSPKRNAIVALHQVIREDSATLAKVLPMGTAYDGYSFPALADRCEYKESELRQLESWIVPDFLAFDLTFLQRRICVWRSRYIQIRRWIIIVTPEELKTTPVTLGIELMTLEQFGTIVAS